MKASIPYYVAVVTALGMGTVIPWTRKQHRGVVFAQQQGSGSRGTTTNSHHHGLGAVARRDLQQLLLIDQDDLMNLLINNNGGQQGQQSDYVVAGDKEEESEAEDVHITVEDVKDAVTDLANSFVEGGGVWETQKEEEDVEEQDEVLESNNQVLEDEMENEEELYNNEYEFEATGGEEEVQEQVAERGGEEETSSNTIQQEEEEPTATVDVDAVVVQEGDDVDDEETMDADVVDVVKEDTTTTAGGGDEEEEEKPADDKTTTTPNNNEDPKQEEVEEHEQEGEEEQKEIEEVEQEEKEVVVVEEEEEVDEVIVDEEEAPPVLAADKNFDFIYHVVEEQDNDNDDQVLPSDMPSIFPVNHEDAGHEDMMGSDYHYGESGGGVDDDALGEELPSDMPSLMPSDAPSTIPSDVPSSLPSSEPTTTTTMEGRPPPSSSSSSSSTTADKISTRSPSSSPSSAVPSPVPFQFSEEWHKSRGHGGGEEEEREPLSAQPISGPTMVPTTSLPSDLPSSRPSDTPSLSPSAAVTTEAPSSVVVPSDVPSMQPSAQPSTPQPSSSAPTTSAPTVEPSQMPSDTQSSMPSSSRYDNEGADFRDRYAPSDYISCDGGLNRIYPASTDITVSYPYSVRVDINYGMQETSSMRPLLTGMEQDLLQQLMPLLCRNRNFLAASAMPYDLITNQVLCSTTPADTNMCYEVDGALSMRMADDGAAEMPSIYCDTLNAIESVFSSGSQLAESNTAVLSAEFKSEENSIMRICSITSLDDRGTASDIITNSSGTLSGHEYIIGIAVAGAIVLFLAALIGRKVSQRYRLRSSDPTNYGIRRTNSHGSDTSWRSMISIIFIPSTFRIKGPNSRTAREARTPALVSAAEVEEEDSAAGHAFFSIPDCPSDDISQHEEDENMGSVLGATQMKRSKESLGEGPSSPSGQQQQPRRSSDETKRQKKMCDWSPSHLTV